MYAQDRYIYETVWNVCQMLLEGLSTNDNYMTLFGHYLSIYIV